MANAIYGAYSSNVIANATLSLDSGTADSSYPLTNLQDVIVSKPFMTTGTGTCTIKGNFGSAQRIDVVALLIPGANAGASVLWQQNAADAWGAPTVNTSFTIPTYGNDGFPSNPWLDLTAVSGYSTSGFQYFRVSFVTPGEITKLGGIWLHGAAKTSFTQNPRLGYQQVHTRTVLGNLTDYGTPLFYDQGVTLRSWVGEFPATSAAVYAELLALWKGCKGPVNPFLFIPDPSVNDAMQVRWVSPFVPTALTDTFQNIPFEFAEDGRGQPL